MSNKVISFRLDMIELIFAGQKTVTIRPMKPQPVRYTVITNFGLSWYQKWKGQDLRGKRDWLREQYPHGKAGDILTIRERPNIKLEITSIDTIPLLDLTYDVWMEDSLDPLTGISVKTHWDSFYGDTEYKFANRPWVWVIKFNLAKGSACL